MQAETSDAGCVVVAVVMGVVIALQCVFLARSGIAAVVSPSYGGTPHRATDCGGRAARL